MQHALNRGSQTVVQLYAGLGELPDDSTRTGRGDVAVRVRRRGGRHACGGAQQQPTSTAREGGNVRQFNHGDGLPAAFELRDFWRPKKVPGFTQSGRKCP